MDISQAGIDPGVIIVAGAVLLPLLLVGAGLFLMRGAAWARVNPFAFLLLGIVICACYAVLMAEAFSRRGLARVILYLVLALAWLAWGLWQYRSRSRAGTGEPGDSHGKT